MISGKLENNDVATKRDDPNFAQVSGYIPKDKALKFKISCTALQITQSDALDEAISLWLEKQEKLSSIPETKKKSKGGGMTTNQPNRPEDLAIRVDRVEARLDNLVEIARSLVQNAEIQQQNIAQLAATTERLVTEAAQDRQLAAIDRQEFRTQVQRIWEYLRDTA